MAIADSVVNQAEAVRSGKVSAVELTQRAIRRAREKADLNSLLYVSENAALAQAAAIDGRIAAGQTVGPLCGVPLSIKDALCTTDAPTTSASKILTKDGTYATGWVPDYDATVVAKLRKADAVLIGKTNMDEFAIPTIRRESQAAAAAVALPV
jgi:aspartyl-tRNA(Asn)/glutamyl-tRNA(Gln) amidotransferase subunit A